jgi:hypothetical protein
VDVPEGNHQRLADSDQQGDGRRHPDHSRNVTSNAGHGKALKTNGGSLTRTASREYRIDDR